MAKTKGVAMAKTRKVRETRDRWAERTAKIIHENATAKHVAAFIRALRRLGH